AVAVAGNVVDALPLLELAADAIERLVHVLVGESVVVPLKELLQLSTEQLVAGRRPLLIRIQRGQKSLEGLAAQRPIRDSQRRASHCRPRSLLKSRGRARYSGAGSASRGGDQVISCRERAGGRPASPSLARRRPCGR